MPEPLLHAPWPTGRSTSVHHIQARLAFKQGSGALPALVVGFEGSTMHLEPLSGGEIVAVVVGRPERAAQLLRRADLTRWQGKPLVLFSDSYGVVGIATGPPDAPRQLRVLSAVARLEDAESVEIPAVDETQPSLQLLAAKRVDSARPRTPPSG